MLQDMRKSAQGTVAKIVVGFIIVIFALFGVESIVGSIGGEPEVASVNGEGITESKFTRALEGKRRQILSQMGERVDPDLIDEGLLRSSVLEGMIQEEILRQDAEDKGLFVSGDAVDSYIRDIEQFKVDGKFNGERLQVILRNAGLTLNGYRDSLSSQFVLSQSRSALIASAFVLESERNEIIELDRSLLNRKDYLVDEEGEVLTDSAGNPVPSPYPPGGYKFVMSASIDGKNETLDTAMSGKVDSVTIGSNSSVTLNLAGGTKAALSEVKQILD